MPSSIIMINYILSYSYSTAAANSGTDRSTQHELDPNQNRYQRERINNQPMPQNYGLTPNDDRIFYSENSEVRGRS